MKIAKEIREMLEDGNYLSKTLEDEIGKEWRKDRNEHVEFIINAKFELVKKALSGLIETCESADVMEFGETPDRESIREAKAAIALFEDAA